MKFEIAWDSQENKKLNTVKLMSKTEFFLFSWKRSKLPTISYWEERERGNSKMTDTPSNFPAIKLAKVAIN